MMRRGLVLFIKPLLLQLLVCGLGSSRGIGQTSCPALTPEAKQRLETYLNSLDVTAAPAGTAHAPHNQIVHSEPVNTLCYSRMTVADSTSGAEHIYFVTPDQRFITVALSDTTQDPIEMQRAADDRTEAILLHDPSPSEGEEHSPLRLVIFVDLECPYCRRLDLWLTNLPNDLKSKVRLVYKQMPLGTHPWADRGAALAICAYRQESSAYIHVQQILFDAQSTLTAENFTEQTGRLLANANWIDQTRLKACTSENEYLSKLAADQALATALHVTNTPTLYLNGRRLGSLSSMSELEGRLRAALRQEEQHATLNVTK